MKGLLVPERVLVSTDAVGGVWTYALDLGRSLAARGIDVCLAVLGPSPNPAQRAEADTVPGLTLVETGLPLDWLAESEEALAAASDGLAALAARTGAELAHLNGPALVGQHLWSVPVVTAVHSCVGTWWQAVRSGPPPPDLELRIRATAVGVVAADAVLAPSRAFAESVEAYYRMSCVQTVYNGRAPASAETAAREPFVLSAGRLWDDAKNFDALDEAAGFLRIPVCAAGPLVMPGGGVRSFQHLCVLGSLDAAEMADWHRRALVFVSTALYEPFGLAVLEAAQAGTPLVLSDIPTFRELWDGAAIFVNPEDPIEIASAIVQVADDEILRAGMGAAARDRAAHFTLERMCTGTLAVYGKVLARMSRWQPGQVGAMR